MDLVCAFYGLFPLPVEEKAVSWTWRQGAKALTGPAGPLQAPQECGGHAEKSPFPRQALGKENVRVHPDLGEKITQANFTDGQGRKANRSTPVIDVRGIEMGLPPCPSRKRPSHGHGVLAMGFSPLPDEGKAGSWTWCALAMGFSPCLSWKRPSHGLAMDFSPCLSTKRPSHGLGVRLRWAFPPACRGKKRIMVLACA